MAEIGSGALYAPMFVNNLARIRESKGLSRPDLAKLVSPPTSPQQIERLEKGMRSLKLEWIERLAKALEVDELDLILPEDRSDRPAEVRIAEPVARQVARVLGLAALQAEPADSLVTNLAILLQEFVETLAAHPAARRDPEVSQPVIDLLSKRFVRQ